MKNLLVIDRFNVYCGNCKKEIGSRLVRACPFCRQQFKFVSTHHTCGWMKDAVRERRRDLVFVEPTSVFSNEELVI